MFGQDSDLALSSRLVRETQDEIEQLVPLVNKWGTLLASDPTVRKIEAVKVVRTITDSERRGQRGLNLQEAKQVVDSFQYGVGEEKLSRIPRLVPAAEAMSDVQRLQLQLLPELKAEVGSLRRENESVRGHLQQVNAEMSALQERCNLVSQRREKEIRELHALINLYRQQVEAQGRYQRALILSKHEVVGSQIASLAACSTKKQRLEMAKGMVEDKALAEKESDSAVDGLHESERQLLANLCETAAGMIGEASDESEDFLKEILKNPIPGTDI